VVEARGRRLVFLDPAGAFKGYATGRPEGGPAAEISWLHGMDLGKLARSCHGLEAIGYVADPARLEFEAYRAVLGEETPFAVCLGPMPPDCDSATNLAEKLSVACSLGVTRMDFLPLRLSAAQRARLDSHGAGFRANLRAA
jgi:hypothetical protein